MSRRPTALLQERCFDGWDYHFNSLQAEAASSAPFAESINVDGLLEMG